MYSHMLKNDMKKRKGINLILFLFITLATVFLASSMNNILNVTSAVSYYLDYAHVPDSTVIVNGTLEKSPIDTWMDEAKTTGVISAYAYEEWHAMKDQSVQVKKGSQIAPFDSKGASVYVGLMNKRYNQVFDSKGNSFTLKQGEIGVSLAMMERNQLSTGDKIILPFVDGTRELVISCAMKDAAFGNEMVGITRFIVSEEDYGEIKGDATTLGLYNVMTYDSAAFTKQLDNHAFETIMNMVQKDMYPLVYSFDMIMAALLILVGVCLILISLLVLRFTIIFTLEEQYQEIGILKTIGLRNFAIKKLYLIKYFIIVSAGALLGLLVSFPVSKAMIQGVAKNMIMASSKSNFTVNLVSALLVIILVLIFSYLCTRKLNKVSAITAIHSGKSGEGYHRSSALSLAKRKRMPLAFYLGMNDIFTHLKRYAILIITFCISFILITIPLNTLQTMNSPEMIKKFMLDPKSAVLLQKIEAKGEAKYNHPQQLIEGMKRITIEMKAKGYDAKLKGAAIYFMNYADNKTEQKRSIMTLQQLGGDYDYAQYSEGVAPELANEIAFSRDILKEEAWSVGDYVTLSIHGSVKKMLITGTYSDYMQIGKSARLNPTIDCNQEFMFDYWSVMVSMKTDFSQDEMARKMQKEFPDYEWSSAQQLVDHNIGGIQDSLAEMLFPMSALLCAIIMLITLLMEKLFITREKGEIAMMKSMGFTLHNIRNWQLVRMGMVAFCSLIISIPLSLFSNTFLLKPIFAIMGAEITIQVNPLEAYLLYPGILLLGILTATLLATRDIKHIHIREINTVE